MTEIDQRIIRVSIEINGALRTYSEGAISVSGTKFTNPNQGECNITLTNLNKETSDFILTEGSPLNRNRTPKRIIVEAGRQNEGFGVLYTGMIYRATGTQPPDASISIRALTGAFQSGNIISRSAGAFSPLSQIAASVASDLGLSLVFETQDKNVANYNFFGGAYGQVEKLAEISGADVYVDNDRLILKNRGEALRGQVRRLTSDSGLVGVPILTEQGAKITFLYDTQTNVGSQIELESSVYPTLNGNYVIYKLNYILALRETPFYYVADCTRVIDD